MGFCLERRGREGEDQLVCGFSFFFSLLIVGGILAPPSPSPDCVCVYVRLQCLTILGCRNTQEDRLLLLAIVIVLSLQVHLPQLYWQFAIDSFLYSLDSEPRDRVLQN